MRIEFPGSVLLLAVGLLACGDEPQAPPPGPPPDLGGPTILANELSLDSVARVVRRRVVAHDPDGVVRIACSGSLRGLGFDSLVLAVPFSVMRRYSDLNSFCTATQNDSTVQPFVSLPDYYPLDAGPTSQPLQVPASLHVGVPTQWAVSLRDDWGLGSINFVIAQDSPSDPCYNHWNEVGNWAGAGRLSVDTVITVTFAQPGQYCAGFGAYDDIGPASGHHTWSPAFFTVLP